MSLIDALWQIGESIVPPDLVGELAIIGVWDTRLWFAPSPNEVLFKCNYVIAHTHHQGCAFYSENDFNGHDAQTLLGQHFTVAKRASLPFKIAVADSLFAFASRNLTHARQFSRAGTPTEKASWRAHVVGEEAARLLGRASHSRRPRVVLIGVSGLILDELITMGCSVAVFDLDPAIVGSYIRSGLQVLHGNDVYRHVRHCDLAVVTGMTLSTRTLDKILRHCKKTDTKVLVYAQTAANMAPWYLLYGVDTVVSERIPFYNFEGTSEILVYRKELTVLPIVGG